MKIANLYVEETIFFGKKTFRGCLYLLLPHSLLLGLSKIDYVYNLRVRRSQGEIELKSVGLVILWSSRFS